MKGILPNRLIQPRKLTLTLTLTNDELQADIYQADSHGMMLKPLVLALFATHHAC